MRMQPTKCAGSSKGTVGAHVLETVVREARPTSQLVREAIEHALTQGALGDAAHDAHVREKVRRSNNSNSGKPIRPNLDSEGPAFHGAQLQRLHFVVVTVQPRIG